MIGARCGVILLVVLGAISGCNGNAPVGSYCNVPSFFGRIEDAADLSQCKAGDIVRTFEPKLYCDFKYQTTVMRGEIVYCVYVGKRRDIRKLKEAAKGNE